MGGEEIKSNPPAEKVGKTFSIKVKNLKCDFQRFSLDDIGVELLEDILNLEIDGNKIAIGKLLYGSGFLKGSNIDKVKDELDIEKQFTIIYQQLAIYWYTEISIPLKKNTTVTGL